MLLRVLLLLLVAGAHTAGAQRFDPLSYGDSAALRHFVTVFAHDSMKGRLSFTPDARRTAAMINDSFRRYGLVPVFAGGMLHPFVWEGESDNNVVAMLPGKSRPRELVIFSAHYDHIGTTRNSRGLKFGQVFNKGFRDSVFNGANDNASGIAMLLALAKYYSYRDDHARTLCFIAFGGEERGLTGSTALARELSPGRIVSMINFDMVGRFPKGTRAATGLSGDDLSSLRSVLNNRLAQLDSADREWTFLPDPEPGALLFLRSDNFPFAAFGVPAHTIVATPDSDKYYHSLAEETETLDFAGMALLFRKLAMACSGLVSGEDTPTRIRP